MIMSQNDLESMGRKQKNIKEKHFPPISYLLTPHVSRLNKKSVGKVEIWFSIPTPASPSIIQKGGYAAEKPLSNLSTCLATPIHVYPSINNNNTTQCFHLTTILTANKDIVFTKQKMIKISAVCTHLLLYTIFQLSQSLLNFLLPSSKRK